MIKQIFLITLFLFINLHDVFSREEFSGQTLEDILKLPEEKIDLAISKLVIDKMVNPSIDINHYLVKLDEMIVEIKKILGLRSKSMDKMLSIKTYLFNKGEWNNNQPFVYD